MMTNMNGYYCVAFDPRPVTMSSLSSKLESTLKSRDDRQIRRRLLEPINSDTSLVDFTSSDYLSLSHSRKLRDLFLSKLSATPDILGSGGSRLLVNGRAHSDLEARLAKFFQSPAALLFNSGFDANVGLFSCIPQLGDVVVYDEYIHASVHDGIRYSRAHNARYPFQHNSIPSLRELLLELRQGRAGLKSGQNSVFVAVESLYSMDGSFSPLLEVVNAVEEIFSKGNGYVIVDEAHSTGIYGPQGKGMVARLGLENRVLARLHTFGKVLAGTGGTHHLVR
jgi:8-amino-7-oxononanoate synthase